MICVTIKNCRKSVSIDTSCISCKFKHVFGGDKNVIDFWKLARTNHAHVELRGGGGGGVCVINVCPSDGTSMSGGRETFAETWPGDRSMVYDFPFGNQSCEILGYELTPCTYVCVLWCAVCARRLFIYVNKYIRTNHQEKGMMRFKFKVNGI